VILIDKPYVSDFFIQTILKNQIPVIKTAVAEELLTSENIHWISEKDAINNYTNSNSKIYTNSENSIGWISDNLNSTKLPQQIAIFKNKIQFREAIKAHFPNYFFEGIPLSELNKYNPENLQFPIIIKPAVGFFSVGVYKINSLNDWNTIIEKVIYEVENLKEIYPKEVINTTDFILEECIEGEEFAIDSYIDENGQPVILNILHHYFSSDDDVSDRVYSTSKEIVEKNYQKVFDFLQILSAVADLKNFPLHIEVRINKEGELIPIEVNPQRFGGWCTTADLTWFAYGFNSYTHFLENKKPNWDTIFKNKEDKTYSIVILDNNSGYKAEDITSFNFKKLLSEFNNPMELRKVDFTKFPLFGFVFIETLTNDNHEIQHILTSNLREYIELKK
jgi:hypothetical protein